MEETAGRHIKERIKEERLKIETDDKWKNLKEEWKTRGGS